MRIELSTISPCERELTITVPKDRVHAEFEKIWHEIRKSATLPGFRPGKAPRSILERRYGDGVAADVRSELLEAALREAIDKNGLDIVSSPDVDLDAITAKDGEDLDFKVRVEVKPDFDLPKYRDLEIAVPCTDVSEQDVEATLLDLREQRGQWAPVTSGDVKTGDLVLVSFVVRDGDRTVLENEECFVDPTTAEILDIPLPGLIEKLVGRSVGDSLLLDAAIPPGHADASIAGRTLKAEIRILEAKRMELPVLDDEFARSMDYENLEDLRDDARQRSQAARRSATETTAMKAILARILESAHFDLPPRQVARIVAEKSRTLAERLEARGVDAGAAASMVAERRLRIEAEVRNELRTWYVLERIGRKERIFALEDDVNAEIEAIARSEGRTPSAVREELEEHDALPDLRTSVQERKIRDFLYRSSRIVESKTPPDDAGGGDRSKETAHDATQA